MDIVPSTNTTSNLIPETTFIYRLLDPTTQEIRYIGKANNPKDRFKQHLAHSFNQMKGTHAGYWIASLRKRGLQPIMEIIEEVPFVIWEEREQYWIEWYLQHGHPLTNTYFGGKGVGMVPPETRAKMSNAHKGAKRSPEAIKKSADARRGKPMSDEQKAKLSAARKGKPGHPSTPEINAKIASAHRGKPRSPETRAKMSAAKKGKKLSLETRLNMSLGKKRARAIRENPPDSPTLFD